MAVRNVHVFEHGNIVLLDEDGGVWRLCPPCIARVEVDRHTKTLDIFYVGQDAPAFRFEERAAHRVVALLGNYTAATGRVFALTYVVQEAQDVMDA